jgi:hypothetical protein
MPDHHSGVSDIVQSVTASVMVSTYTMSHAAAVAFRR